MNTNTYNQNARYKNKKRDQIKKKSSKQHRLTTKDIFTLQVVRKQKQKIILREKKRGTQTERTTK